MSATTVTLRSSSCIGTGAVVRTGRVGGRAPVNAAAAAASISASPFVVVTSTTSSSSERAQRHHRRRRRRRTSSQSTAAAAADVGDATATAAAALGIEYPGSAPGEGVRGRGLFANGSSPDVPLIRTPLDVILCVPEAVGPDAPTACADAVRATYSRWGDSLGVTPPNALVDFLIAGEMPKDVRIAVALMWATRHIPAWADYGKNVMPQRYDSLYLASEEELEALQDESVRRMAAGSRVNYAAGWNAIGAAHPEVVAALNADAGGAAGTPATQEEFDWARATAHTRAMGAKVGGAPCAFIVPGVDLANHSFAPNATYGVSPDGDHFQLLWRGEEGVTCPCQYE